jgi:hypothetical protein
VKRLYVIAIAAMVASIGSSQGQTGPAANHPYHEEWVFHVRWGHQHEWWKLFQKYQIATLDREKQLGFVTSYTVEVPDLHASDDSRWDYRVIINYPNYDASNHGDDVEAKLFPDAATRDREEQRRWDLTINHWDLPVHEIDPHK